MAQKRRENIVKLLSNSEVAVSATTLAAELGVTRQVIVGDVALLRASGVEVIATPRGYVMEKGRVQQYLVACEHGAEEMANELYAVVDCGCGIIDVTVEHGLYGEITCPLHIFSRKDADEFLKKFKESGSRPLSDITGNVHLHRLECPSESHYFEVKKVLKEKGVLRDEEV